MPPGSYRTPPKAPGAPGLEHASSFDELAGKILDATRSVLGAATAAMFLVEGDSELRLVVSRGYSDAEVSGFERLRTDDPYPIPEAVRTGVPIWLESPQAWAERYPRLTLQAKGAQRSWAVLPLIADGVIYGALGLGWADPQRFDEATERSANELAVSAARALARFGSVDHGVRRLRLVAALAKVATTASSRTEMCELVARVLDGGREDIPFALVYLLDDSGEAMRLAVRVGLPDDDAAAPPVLGAGHVDDLWPFLSPSAAPTELELKGLASRIGRGSTTTWPGAAEHALVLPLVSSDSGGNGVLIAGLHPTLRNEPGYRELVALVATQVSVALTVARGHENRPPRTMGQDGGMHSIELTGNREPVEGGGAPRLIGMVQDVTDSGLADRARFLERIAQVTPGVLHVFDLAERRSVFINRSVASLLGFGPEELFALGPDVAPSLMHPDDLPGFEQHLVRVRALADGEVATFQHRMRDRAGVWHWFDSHDAVFARDAAGAARQLIGVSTEITEHKRAEEAMVRLAAIVDTTEDAILSVDLDGRVTTWNRGAEAIFGYRADEITGEPVTRLIPDDQQAEELALRRTVAESGRAGHLEAILCAKDGRQFPAAVTVSPLKDAEGRFIGTSRIVRDITERKRAEESLRQNTELFSALIAQAPMGTFVTDGQLRMLQVNEEAMPAFASLQPVIGRDLPEMQEILWGPDLGRQLADIFRHTLATGERYVSPPFTETRHDLGLEQTYEWETQRVTLPDGEHGVVCYFHEVTDRARAIEALRASEQRMRLATEATHVGIWEWNLRTNQVSWDAEMFSVYGIAPTPDGLVEYADWSGAVVPEDLAENEAILQDTVRRCGRSKRTFRIRRRDDGKSRTIEAVEAVRRNSNGEAECVVGTNLDVTERVRAEEELRRLASELSEASRRKDEFLATLAHELRNPLAPILSGLQLMGSNARGAAPEKLRTMMERQLGHMVHLIDDLLDVSRISQGKLELRKQRIELATALNSALETSQLLIKGGGHDLTVAIPSAPIFVEADLTRLGQVFANLLNNAAKYSEPGAKIRISVERDGSDAVVSVKDTGIGIAPDMLRKVFEMFAQVNPSHERSQGGLGIGLSLVKQLVELHGGSVEARSEGRGKGSEFIVRLPVVAIAEPEVQLLTADAEPSGNRRILVADDNEDAADMLAMLLESLGNEVRTANDGSAAVDVAASFRPDVIMLDIGMPALNGYEACRRIREQPWGGGPVLVALTGWGQVDDKRRSQEAGFDHHLVKPVDFATVKRLLASLPPQAAGVPVERSMVRGNIVPKDSDGSREETDAMLRNERERE
jgi:PAS domain S-box-containing protein